ncbi:MAG TPA: hypothetical protein VG870_08950 [Chitinophagaceae bacterium]|nr:hypothetical protein [Chitinophagaceae bacterium]
MPENEFEKQVRRTLDDLKLHPSDRVGSLVEHRIREPRKRRRLPLVLLASGLLLLGYGGYRFWSSPAIRLDGRTGPRETAATSGTRPTPMPARDQVPAGEGTQGSPGTPDQPGRLRSRTASWPAQAHPGMAPVPLRGMEGRAPGQKPARNVPVFHPDPVSSLAAGRKPRGTTRHQLRPPQVRQALTGVSRVTRNPHTGESSPSKGQVSQAFLPDNPSGYLPRWNRVITVPDSAVSASWYLRGGLVPVHLPDRSAALLNQPAWHAAKNSEAQWRWGLEFTGGLATRSSRFLGWPGGAGAAGLTINRVGAGVNGGGVGFASSEPSSVQPGPELDAGFFLERRLSRRLSVQAGLQYRYASDRILVGNNTYNNFQAAGVGTYLVAIQAVSAGFPTHTYVNQYHYLGIPVIMGWRLNPRSILPLNLRVGFSADRLLATDAVFYSGTSGGFYYPARASMNKFYVLAHAGLEVVGSGRRSRAWSVGPMVSLSTTRQVRDAFNRKVYPVYGGLQVRYRLGPGK